ncbi:MAG: type I DNA topoisomerase [Candidatus Levybacteria bacterium]|nr:type I DNA topoisomerase [Candidatus Levybacteria bacterium]
MKTLVIVESPTKARTIGKYLGDDYIIKYSMGHIMDLPKSTLGVDVENNFTPQIEVLTDKKKLIAELKAAAKGVENILLATDPDREGEAIAANIQTILSEIPKSKTKSASQKFSRIVFHEITEGAIKEAMTHPRDVDTNLVDAQTARRVLDRLVGYKLSPLLWQKVRRGLSAGRVQSVALRLIAEREKEIEKFQKEPYWTIHVGLKQQTANSKQQETIFDLVEIDAKKIELSESFELYDGTYKISKTTIDTQEKAREIVTDIKTRAFEIAEVNQRQAKRSPAAPFTTSTLQQDASRRFGYSGKRTMSLAQRLYEEGYITYHRTDSTTMSEVAITQIRDFVKKEWGEKYVPEKSRQYAAKQKSAQEAHEAIRPTKFSVKDSTIAQDLEKDAAKLYDLIWRRAVGSQMSDALIESTTVFAVTIEKGIHDYRVKTTGSVLVFEGFLKINPQALQDTTLPQFKAKEKMKVTHVLDTPHETPAPPRYNDASIIATLEEKGIGRPSTYASIIATLVDRAYVERVEKRFEASAVGMAVNDFLVTNFADIDDIPFTADMEDKLDLIADGKTDWKLMMKEFYDPLALKLATVKDADRVKIKTESIDQKCPECGNELVIRTGKFGKFISCSTFPTCKYTKPFVEETGMICPQDGGNVIVKKTRKGRKFFGCANYPACTFAAWKLEDIKKADEATNEEEVVKEV